MFVDGSSISIVTEKSYFKKNKKKGDMVEIYTKKGEAVALAESMMSEEEIRDAIKGYGFETKRIIMAPNTYPKKWRSKSTPKD